MRRLWFLIILISIFISGANAQTQSYNFTIQNNTGFNFEGGYYIIEVIEINNHAPKVVKVNLTTSGSSKTYNLYEGENPYLNFPYDRIDLMASSIFDNTANLQVFFPDDWGSPEPFTVTKKVESVKIPDIVLTKSADKTSVNIGDVIEIKIIVENKGNGTAEEIKITETFPNGFSRAPGVVFPPVVKDSLEAGEIQELYYALKAVESGSFNIESTVVSYGSKSSKSNKLGITVLKEEEKKSHLETVITLDKNNVVTGDLIEVKVDLTNDGEAPAGSVMVDGTLPSGFEIVEGDLRQLYKKIEPGESEQYTVTLKAVEEGNYSISLKTVYNHELTGSISNSEDIIVTKNERDYLLIIMPAGIIVIGIILFTIKRHKEYRF